MTLLRQNRELKRLGIWNWSLPAFAGKLHNVMIIGVGSIADGHLCENSVIHECRGQRGWRSPATQARPSLLGRACVAFL
ncbi:hypothetical protein OHS18_13470 [Amycolatopsis sp. NBC_00355]